MITTVRLLVAGAALAAVAGLVLGRAGTRAQTVDVAAGPRRAVAVELEAVAPRKLQRQIVVPGVVEARARVQLSFDVGGRIAEFFVDEGDSVREGDVIVSLDTEDLERELELARAAQTRAAARAEEANSSLRRHRGLFKARSISQQALDRALVQAQVASAEAREAELRTELAQTRLDKATLRAPMSGYIERRLAEAHEQTEPGVPVVVLADLDRVRVRAAVPDRRARALALGAPAAIASEAWPSRAFRGEIVQIDLAADAETRAWPFEVELANPELLLRPELWVSVALPQEADEALTLPLVAVLRDAGERAFCFVASGEADAPRAERRALVLGEVLGERVVVREGLRPGDRVVVRGQHFVRPGDALGVLEN